MKSFFLFIIIVLCIPNLVNAQQDTTRKLKMYKTWISLIGEPNKTYHLKGALYKIQDSSILISHSLQQHSYSEIEPPVSKIDFNTIDLIKLRQKNGVLKGVLTGLIIGTLAGAVFGAIKGLNSWLEPPQSWFVLTPGQKALLTGATVGIVFTIGVTAEETKKIKIPIKGNYMNFDAQRNLLEKYSIR